MLVALVLCAALPGCFTAQYAAEKPLEKKVAVEGARVLIIEPADGEDKRPRTYYGSGQQVARAMRNVMMERGAIVDGSGTATPLSTATSRGTLTITPKILLWEDRVTEWSGLSDQLKISVRVTQNGRLIDERTVTAKSKWWTFGGDHPQEMLEDLFRTWAKNVFEKPAKK